MKNAPALTRPSARFCENPGKETLPIRAFLISLILACLPALAALAGGDIAIVQYEVQDPDAVGVDADRLAGLVREAARGGAKLVVCPETPFYRYAPFDRNGVTMTDLASSCASLSNRFSTLATDLGICLVVGLREPDGSGGTFNVALFFAPDGTVLGRHRKGLPSRDEHAYTSPGPGRATVFNSPVGRVAMAVCKDVLLSAVRASVTGDHVQLFVLPAADRDGGNLADIGDLCREAGCQGILANQQIDLGNSAAVSRAGEATYFGRGEGVFYAGFEVASYDPRVPPQRRGGIHRPIQRVTKPLRFIPASDDEIGGAGQASTLSPGL